ncbi:CBO0543 family protein [Heliorestis convoluta]|uniref:Putative membrane protein n=1 Tax=Heliorestis convoluta TaxID=356322 RepID=A0A5Q2MZB8_9FIRM|nr:CBO0543 family protein [Heliorestis convoluta]QGG48324.1 putative membrane protein [Heliorestis convoluta]
MIINIVLAFILPWIFGLLLYRKDKFIVLLTAPIASAVAFLFNELGFSLGYWLLYPIYDHVSISALPFNLGLYPVVASYFGYLLIRRSMNHLWLILLFPTALTAGEAIAHYLSLVMYFNGWNIGWTFVSYFAWIVIIYYYSKKIHPLLETYRNND